MMRTSRERARARALLAVLLTLALLPSACRPPEDPAQRYLRFASAARGGDDATAWALLSTASQDALRARAAALRGGKDGPRVDLSARDLVLGDLAATAPTVKGARVASQRGDDAVVEVDLEGGTHGQVTMHREADGWRVVLPPG